MTPNPPMPAFRMTRGLLLAAVAAVVAVAAPATALLGLPIGLPSAEQSVSTPAGSADVYASEQGIDTCVDLATPALPVPALPAVPALPVPVAVPAVPALPTPYAASQACIAAGPDGASANVGLDAAGAYAGTGIDARSPVSSQEIDSTAQGATGEAKGFFESLMDKLFGWI